ncbi:hypothetical protein MUK42_34060 [Musa troglodytarum]|uniref:Uncharacterized protein n=1 Tax=Musa troglodytarum TaxID=320322 RepID=A0A9E7EBA1_9LILI|nr:hypothetical protein MUK42_34060 [Musa troglodytarum]
MCSHRASCMQHHNPALSCGIAVGMGLVPFKSQSYLVFLFSLLDSAQAKVRELQHSVNVMMNESRKLEVTPVVKPLVTCGKKAI